MAPVYVKPGNTAREPWYVLVIGLYILILGITQSASFVEAVKRISQDHQSSESMRAFVLNRIYFEARALQYYRKDFEARGPKAELLDEVAWILCCGRDHSIQDGQQAVLYAQQAVELDKSTEARHLYTLTEAYARVGRYTDARNAIVKALSLMPERTLFIRRQRELESREAGVRK